MSARCRSCQRPIRWTTTTNGRRLPIDPQPADDGNVRLLRSAGAEPLADVLSRDDALIARHEAGVQLYRSHFSTCPDAHRHRSAMT